MRLTLQQKISLGLLLPLALLLLLTGLLTGVFLRQEEHRARSAVAQANADALATRLSQLLQSLADSAAQTAALAAREPQRLPQQHLDFLASQLRLTPAAQGAGFAQQDAEGRWQSWYVQRGEGGEAGTQPAGQARLAEWTTATAADWASPYYDAAGKAWVVTRRVPLRLKDADGRERAGVAIAELRLDRLTSLLPDLEPDDWLLVDAQGRLLHAHDLRQRGRPYTDWAPAGSEHADQLAGALAGQGPAATVLAWPDGHLRASATATVPQTGWVLLRGTQLPDSIWQRSHQPLLLVLMGACAVLLLLWLHWRLKRQMAPLRALVHDVGQLAAGSPAQPVEPASGDEVKALAEGVTELNAQLRGQELHLVSRQRELADRVREQQVLYRVADVLGWSDTAFTEMLRRVCSLLTEAWPRPEQVSCRINLAEHQSVSEQFHESRRGLFAPIEAEAGAGGGVWVFAHDEASAMEAGQQELIEGVAQQLGLAWRRERAQQQLERFNRELEQRVELRTLALRNAERLLRDITNTMPGAVYQVVQTATRTPELRFVSAGVEGVFGVPREQALASYEALMNLVFPADLSELNAVVADAIARKKPYSHVHRIGHAASGQVRWIRSAASPVAESDGTVLLNGYWIDVSDQKELELELETSRLEADAANEAKSRFLANMSHEIRTPMNAIIGLTHLAVQQTHEAKVRDQLTRVEESAKDLLGLLNDILDFSKIEAGRMTVERTPFDLWNVLDRVQSLMSERAGEKGLMFSIWRVPNLPRDLMGDPLRLHQVLLNLVSNAVKFTEVGSVTLNVTVLKDDAASVRLCFEVVDTGIGIDPIQMTRLFSAFTQADNSTTRRFGGTGLGLTICKQLVSLMGGEITVDSVPSSGSSFKVTLGFDYADPVWREEPRPETGDVQADPLVGARVLLVDDNHINLEVAGELLRQTGVEVVTATNGREALEKLAGSEYDAVLMDLQMPVMDGFTATAEIRANPDYENLPVIAMTANAMSGDRERCIEAGMNDHVPKPIDPEELRRTLSRWLRRRSSGDLGATLPPMV